MRPVGFEAVSGSAPQYPGTLPAAQQTCNAQCHEDDGCFKRFRTKLRQPFRELYGFETCGNMRWTTIAFLAFIIPFILYFTLRDFFGSVSFVFEQPPVEFVNQSSRLLTYSDRGNYTILQLAEPPKTWQTIQVNGRFAPNPARVCVSLSKTPNDENAVMSICAEFGFGKSTLYQSFANDKPFVNSTGPNPLEPDEPFDFRVRIVDKFVQVFAAQGEIGIFEKSPDIHDCRTMSVSGSIAEIAVMYLTGDKYTTPGAVPISVLPGTRLDFMAQPVVTYNNSQEFLDTLPNSSPTGSVVRVKRRGGGHGGGGHGGGGHGGGGRGHSSSRSSSRGGGGRSYSTHSSRFSSRSRGYSASRSASSSTPSGRVSNGVYHYNPSSGGYYSMGHSSGSYSSYSPATYSYHVGSSTHYHHTSSSSSSHHSSFTAAPRVRRYDFNFYSQQVLIFVISIRYDEQTVVMNENVNGVWDDEARPGFLPFDDWRVFDMTIFVDADKFFIFANRFILAEYDISANMKTHVIDSVEFTGDIEIFNIAINGTTIKSLSLQ